MSDIDTTIADRTYIDFPGKHWLLVPDTVYWLTGSRSYGMNLPDSDYDYTFCYLFTSRFAAITMYDKDIHPEKFSWKRVEEGFDFKGEDNKAYSFRRLCELIQNGNANLVELTLHEPQSLHVDVDGAMSRSVKTIREFMEVVAPHVVTPKTAFSYHGHVHGVLRELEANDAGRGKPVTNKRIAHALRLIFSLEYILTTGKLRRWTRNDELIKMLTQFRVSESEPLRTEMRKILVEKEKELLPKAESYKADSAGRFEQNLRDVIEDFCHSYFFRE